MRKHSDVKAKENGVGSVFCLNVIELGMEGVQVIALTIPYPKSRSVYPDVQLNSFIKIKFCPLKCPSVIRYTKLTCSIAAQFLPIKNFFWYLSRIFHTALLDHDFLSDCPGIFPSHLTEYSLLLWKLYHAFLL